MESDKVTKSKWKVIEKTENDFISLIENNERQLQIMEDLKSYSNKDSEATFMRMRELRAD